MFSPLPKNLRLQSPIPFENRAWEAINMGKKFIKKERAYSCSTACSIPFSKALIKAFFNVFIIVVKTSVSG